MPSERARRRGRLLDVLGPAQRRHRIRALPRTFERIAPRIDLARDVPGLTRHADFVLDRVVVRLELLEPERPVLHRRSLRDARGPVSALRLADDLEVPRIQPPALR